MIVCSPCLHVHISVCVLLKIDSGISRALFIAVKAFNPFTSGFEQRLHAFGERGWQRSVKAEGEIELEEKMHLMHETPLNFGQLLQVAFTLLQTPDMSFLYFLYPVFLYFIACQQPTTGKLQRYCSSSDGPVRKHTVILMCASLSSVSLAIGWRKKGFSFTFSIY